MPDDPFPDRIRWWQWPAAFILIVWSWWSQCHDPEEYP